MNIGKRSQAVLACVGMMALALVLAGQTASTLSYIDANSSASELLAMHKAKGGKVLGASIVQPILPTGITSNGDGTYSGTVMKTTLNSTNFPGLFSSPIIKTVKASGGDYTDLQTAFNAIGTDAPTCNEIIVVDSGYTAASLASNQTLTYQYTCPTGAWVWVRPSNYASLPPQGQTICTTAVTSASENSSQTTATFTTSRAHLLTVGMNVRIKGVADNNFNADYVVLSVPNATTFTVANTVAGFGASSAGGTVIPDNLYLNPNACPDIPNMFTVAKTGGNVYDTALAINDYTAGGTSSQGLIISGMQMAITPGATTFIGVMIGGTNITTPNYINHIILDRNYIVAPANTNMDRAVSMNGPYEALVDSYTDGTKDASGNYAETQGVVMFFAPGPYKIVDNYIGGMPTENIFSGGLPVLVQDAIPSDIEIRTNTLYDDFAHPSISRSKKNFIEFKGSKRLLIDGNTLEYSWAVNTGSAQNGAAFVLNTLAQGAPATWLTNQDTTFTNNDVQHFGSSFLALPGRTGFSNSPTYPLNARTMLSNNVYRDWNQKTYNLNFGGSNSAGFNTQPGYSDASYPPSGPDNTTLIHNGFYGSPSNQDNFANLALFFRPPSYICPGSPTYTGTAPLPDLTVHANITIVDNEFNGDCYGSYDLFNNNAPGLFINPNWSGNVHVQNGVGATPSFIAGDFSTAGPENQFPNGGASGVAPTGMFNSYSSCNSVPAGPLTSCALQSGSSYKNTSYCDGSDCGPNISTIETAQVRSNDGDTSSSPIPTPTPTPTPDITPPVISSIVTSGLTQANATVSWITDKLSDSQVEYGLTTSYGISSFLNSSLATSHSVALTTLSAGTLYHYRVKSRDSSGNLAVSADQLVTTLTLPGITPTPTSSPTPTPTGLPVSLGLIVPTVPNPTTVLTPTPVVPGLASATSLKFSGFVSNTLVLDNGTIYIIEGTFKIPFSSLKAFLGLGYTMGNVVTGDTSNYRLSTSYVLNSPAMRHPWGSWLLKSKTVYYYSPQGFIPVPSWQTFLSNGGNSTYIVPMNKAELRVLQTNPRLPAMAEGDVRVGR